MAGVATYHGGSQIEQAQAALERHAVSSADGLCVSCGVPGPCTAHETATKVFAQALRLPHRVPGATRPETTSPNYIGYSLGGHGRRGDLPYSDYER